LNGFGRPKFFDVGPARKGFASTGQDDGLDVVVGQGFIKARHDGLPGAQTHAIDGRVVDGDHCQVALDGVVSAHAIFLR
jgi:hypothetical protein